MANENKQKLMEDAEDEGLRAVMGSKFQDVSREIPKASVSARSKARRKTAADPKEYPSHLKTAADIPSNIPEGEWIQLNRVSPMAKLKACAKGAWLYGCISLLLFWWQQAGLLDSRAAVPSFIVLALLVGVQIGRICRE
jgi:hypothetical protein